MDPLSHAAFGFTLGALTRRTRVGTAAPRLVAIGALVPDIDAMVMPTGWDRYLVAHEIGTHSVCGALVCAICAAWLIHRRTGAYPLWPAVLAVALGTLSHVALDLFSGATIRLLWPVTDRRFSEPLVAMADPWLAGLLIGGVVVQGLVDRQHRADVARLGMAAVILLLMAKTALLERAMHVYHAHSAHDGVIADLAAVPWGSLVAWHVDDRTEREVRRWWIDARTGTARVLLRVPTPLPGPPDPTRALSTVRNLRRTHDFVFALTAAGSHGTHVFASDVRYCWNPVSSVGPAVTPGTARRPTLAPVACDLWVGGSVDAAGTPSGEVVRLGDLIQARR
jgi:membrane-bound metal-dependent hydrolase YbcI (DUF457 family)